MRLVRAGIDALPQPRQIAGTIAGAQIAKRDGGQRGGRGDGGRSQQQRVHDGAHGALLRQHRAGRGLRVDEGGDRVRGALDDVFEALLKPAPDGARRT